VSESPLSSPSDASNQDESVPIPPRYWWLKRILAASGALLVLLVALRLWWGWIAERRLQAEIDRIVAAGEPIYPEDFDPKEPIPDEENAAKYLLKAEAALNFTLAQTELFERVSSDVTLHDADQEGIKKLLEDNVEALRLARRAREFQGIDWGMRFRTPVSNAGVYPLSGQRKVCRLLHIATRYHAVLGSDDAVAELILDQLSLSRALRRQQTTIAQLVAWAVEGIAVQDVQVSLLVPSPGRPGVKRTDQEPTDRAFRAVIDNLTKESTLREDLRIAMMVSRMELVDGHRQFADGVSPISSLFGGPGGPSAIADPVWFYALAPAVSLDTIRALRIKGEHPIWIDRERIPSEPYAAPNSGSLQTPLDLVLRPLASVEDWSNDMIDSSCRRLIAERRMASTGLAVRLFMRERGTVPNSLVELVPDFLPNVPRDPMAFESRAIGFLPDSEHPILYSVGEDGTDDGGRFTLRGKYVDERRLDLPFFVNGDPPSGEETDATGSRLSRQGNEDSPDEDDERGSKDQEEKREENP